VQTGVTTNVSASADEPQQICAKCGRLLQRVGQGAKQCVACLLELAWDDDGLGASPERFDHYQVATHTDGTGIRPGGYGRHL
jgi:predicted amidophosphoribosyltransferase